MAEKGHNQDGRIKATTGWHCFSGFCSTTKEEIVVNESLWQSRGGSLHLGKDCDFWNFRPTCSVKYQREKDIHKLDGNFNRPPFPAVFHLLMLHLVVHAHSLFEDSVLLGVLLGSKSHSVIFFSQREACLPVPWSQRGSFSFTCLSSALCPYISQRILSIWSPSIFFVYFSSLSCCGQR